MFVRGIPLGSYARELEYLKRTSQCIIFRDYMAANPSLKEIENFRIRENLDCLLILMMNNTVLSQPIFTSLCLQLGFPDRNETRDYACA